jgi:hypothetical protein
VCKYHNYYNSRPYKCVKPCNLVGKLKSCWAFTNLAAIPAHATATAMHYPADTSLIFLTDEQSWARAFFGPSRLRFRASGGILSRSFLGLKFCAFAFALLVFRACIFALLDFHARTFALLISFCVTDFLSRSRFPFAHVCLYIYTHTHMHTSPHTYIHPHTHTYSPTYIHTSPHTYIRPYLNTYIPTY